MGPWEILILCLPHTNFSNQPRADIMKCYSGASFHPSCYHTWRLTPSLLIFNHLNVSWAFLVPGEKGGSRSQDNLCWFRRFGNIIRHSAFKFFCFVCFLGHGKPHSLFLFKENPMGNEHEKQMKGAVLPQSLTTHIPSQWPLRPRRVKPLASWSAGP